MTMYNGQEIYDEEFIRAVERERRDNLKFIQIMEDLAEIAPRMWRFGDGEGGLVLRGIIESLEKAGLQFTRYQVNGIDTRIEKDDIKTYRKKTLSFKVRLNVLANDGYECKHCGTKENLTVDHIVPESKGGSHELDNLQTLCGSCNSKKGVKLQ